MDLIDRQEAIDRIEAIFPVDPHANECAEGVAIGAALAKQYIESLPSAQPTQNTRVNSNNALDTISRQAAIDALRNINTIVRPISESDDVFLIDKAEAMTELMMLPSAQPEQRWIPCSERLPKEYGNYLITTHNGDVDVGTIDPKKKGVWSACDADGFYWIREVVAWMPLPKPPKEDDNDHT